MKTQIERILFVELLGGIGDVAIALPAIHALARSHPHAHITVLTFAPGGELLQTDPHIGRVVFASTGEARQAVDALLAGESFDLIVSDTNYDGIAATIEESGCRVVTNLWQSPPPDQRVGGRFLEILFDAGVITADALAPQPQIHLSATELVEARREFGAALRPLVFLIPDAGMAIKRWSAENFVTLGNALRQRYNATIVIPQGSHPQAAQIAAQIAARLDAQLLPSASLRTVAARLAQADLAIAADTGLARIAAALDIPTITLFGPSWHERYGQPAPHVNLQGFAACPDRVINNFTAQPCWYSGQCPYDWNTCLDDISPQIVLNAAAPFLSDAALKRWRESPLFTPHSSLPASPPPPFSPSSLSPWRSVRNLLVMRLDNIGDVMMTSPALRALRENLPNANITLMASPSGSLTAPLLPGVDEVLPWRVLWQDLGQLEFDPAREWKLVETLRVHQFDAAIIFTSFAQSPHPPALICALAGIPLRLGESKEADFDTLTHAVPPASDRIHQVERNLRLIESVGFGVSDHRLCLTVPTVDRDIPFPYILLNPWTSCPSRNYAPDRFAAAARTLSQKTGWSIVVTGVEKDREHAQPLLSALGEGAIDLIGKTSLGELVALVDRAELVLTNNTSTMHIADATQTPNVVLFAGTEQECQWQPRASPSRLLRRPTVCSPCYAFQCPYELQCLDISPAEVVAAALDLLKHSVCSSESNLG